MERSGGTPRPVTGPGGWGVCWRPAPRARMRLLCLPHAGAGAGVFRAWAAGLAPDIEVIAVRLPGRESRFGEPARTRLEDLVPGLLEGLAPWLDRPHAWFGHSMGALLAFEACRRAAAAGLRRAERLHVACHPAPRLLQKRLAGVDWSSGEELTAGLEKLGGIPRGVRDDPALAAFLPVLRADLEVLRGYRYRPGPPLDVPVSVYGGTRDDTVPAEELDGWREHTTAGCEVRMLPGGHFFPREEPAGLLAAIAAGAAGTVDPAPAVPGRNERRVRDW
ncbi:thioesterase II family protein [Streptomyces sp. YIM 98790]|uniref:thioesterase II family protein n=1 Tax=Streptomyces sp. YIM 98790 TaxID=2689077 RepID=UPI001407E815|nr:alpha/beta fold hydrolase [Streptomyces sp. YIM 98790]